MKTAWVCFVALLLGSQVVAQQSANHKLSDHVFNAGGHPAAGAVIASTNHRVTLDSIGESVMLPGLGSSSFVMDGGFAQCFPPPGEVPGLRFTDAVTLAWRPERSVGDYSLYRGLLSTLPGLGYGACAQQDLAGETATDTDPVPVGDGFFYLVTASNRLGEEGTKGTDGNDATRGGTACP